MALIAGIWNEKPFLQLLIGESLAQQGTHAGNIIKEACKQMGGSGGGQAGFATGSGSEPGKLPDAIQSVFSQLKLDYPLN